MHLGIPILEKEYIMSTQALDLVTLGRALNELSTKYLGDCRWEPLNSSQLAFLLWYDTNKEALNSLENLEELASSDHLLLNEFLVERGFKPMFDKIEGVGVVSVLDMLVNWLIKGELTSISRYERSAEEFGRRVAYPAFRIPAGGVDIYDVEGYSMPLVRLRTMTGHSLWLMKVPEPGSGIELALSAQSILAANRCLNPHWSEGATVPMLEIDIVPDLSWVLGMSTNSPRDGRHVIVQAFQMFKLRANEVGARIKVATGLGTMRGGPQLPTPYVFNEPFIGFTTQPSNDSMPVAAFWADTDSWKNPEGTLEELGLY